MADDPKPGERQWFSDKSRFFDMMKEIDAKAGIVFDPNASVQELRRRLLARGVRPEDNLLSRDIIRVKDPDEEGDRMAVVQKPGEKPRVADKARFLKLMEEIDAKAGILPDPTATAQKAREMMIAQGVRPEDNIFSREIIRARYPEESENESEE
jgi:hypothetical protein